MHCGATHKWKTNAGGISKKEPTASHHPCNSANCCDTLRRRHTRVMHAHTHNSHALETNQKVQDNYPPTICPLVQRSNGARRTHMSPASCNATLFQTQMREMWPLTCGSLCLPGMGAVCYADRYAVLMFFGICVQHSELKV